MGLFNYSKNGPGIDKNAPKKKGIFLFFEILGRKLWKLCQVNIIYFIMSLPMIAIYFFSSTPVVMQIINSINLENNIMTADIMVSLAVFYIVVMLIFLGSGPASSSLAYIQRCFAREEHAWVWKDFIGKMKENFKQGIVVSVIDAVVINLGFFALFFYYNYFIQSGQKMWFFLMCVLAGVILLYVFAHFYIYQLIITFQSKIKEHYKNSLLLALMTLPQNLIFTAFICLVCFGLCILLEPILSIFITLLIAISLLRFPIEYHAQSVIKKKILNNIEKNEESNS